MSASTANSVFVGAVTTILGFGALMIASHRGLESLGRVLTIGITSCTLTSLVILPAVLRIVQPGGVADDADANADVDVDADVAGAAEAPETGDAAAALATEPGRRRAA